ncbi:MAG: DNA translocase FtsK, partial [Clostridia bacterium]|nr:DNA translocase FtsK [Clostridia bacterium]
MANNSGKKPSQAKKSTSGKKQAPKSQTEKKANSKPSASKKEGTGEIESAKKQRIAVLIMGVAILVLFMALIEGTKLWAFLHNSLFGILGFCTYLLPVLLAYVAIIYANEKSLGSISTNLLQVGVVTAIITSAFHIFSRTEEELTDVGLGLQIQEAWQNGATDKKGGIIGAVLGGGLAKLFGKTGAVITVVVLLVVSVLLLTGISLPVILSNLRKPVKKVGEVNKGRMEKKAVEREERRNKKEKERKEKIDEESDYSREDKGKPVQPVGLKIPTISGTEVYGDGLHEPEMITSVLPAGKSGAGLPAMVDGFPDGVQKPEPTENLLPKREPEAKPARTRAKKTVEKETVSTAKETVRKAQTAKEEKPAPSGQGKTHSYSLPSIDLLTVPDNTGVGSSMEEMQSGAQKLVSTLQSFKINAEVTNICRGPSVTRYELVPEAGVRINKITALSDDIAMHLAAKSVRIEAPIPGKSAIGIEVPNSSKSVVTLREIIDTDQYRAGRTKSKLNVALGKDITGNVITADLAKMPHLLVAGTTGSGKSVCLNSMIISLLYNAAPDEVKLLMIDPKMVEFTVYNGISHLVVPVVSKVRQAAGALSWAVSEMEKRYKQFSENGVRDIKSFNNLCDTKEGIEKMYHLVIFIDELSDLMMAAPKEVEDSICRLAQMARAAGIHLVIATQRPSVDVITGVIKANIPSRIALFVSSQTDSRTIIDRGGAEKLLGNGDLLFNPVGASTPQRVQGCYVSDEEIESVVNHVKEQGAAVYSDETMKEIEAKAAAADNSGKNGNGYDDSGDDLDPMFNEAAEVVITAGQASTTMLQKKLKLGYARASRVMDQLEEKGIVGPSEGAKPRQILISKQEWYEQQALAGGSGKREEQMTFDGFNTNQQDVIEDI